MRGIRRARKTTAALLATSLVAVSFAAQASATGATVEGTVVETSSHLPLAGATVHLGDPRSGRVVSALASGAGSFRFDGLPAATYEIAVESDAKLFVVSSPLPLDAGDRRSLNVAVPVGASEGPAKAREEETKGRVNWWNNPATATLAVLAGAVVVGVIVDATIDDPAPTASPSGAP